MNEQLMLHLQGFEDKYPYRLEQEYPRIVDKIAQLWKSPEMPAYFDDLMIDKRGQRQGFPPHVASDLFALSVLYDQIHSNRRDTSDVWNEN